ncbi:tRNA pseudouridine(55) synthase TruB [Candidatus Dependentiae bacterium]|nr:tRNA pseudouridine(55) synthase TruB [Candidatus Dependentiae bacterium]
MFPTQTGYLLINKPKDITSFDCIRHIKKILNAGRKVKIGHAGTLDPFATGLLIVCIGRDATKTISHLLNLDKTYVVKAKLGERTDTLDCTGRMVETSNVQIQKQEIELAIKNLGSSYMQTPPIYSALKHQGQPLYKLVREKKLTEKQLAEIIKAKSRTVTIHNIKLLNYASPYFSFKAQVSKGTYIRSLSNDIAQKAGSIATTYELERTKIGSISLTKATRLDMLKSVDDIQKNMLSQEQVT